MARKTTFVGASSEQISRIGWRAEIFVGAFVAKRPVHIPHGAESPEGGGREDVVTMHEGALGVAKFAVVAQSVDKEIARKGFDIHHLFSFPLFDSGGEAFHLLAQLGSKGLFRLFAIGFDVVFGFGRFDTHGQMEVAFFVFSIVVVEFEERTLAFVFEFHAVGGSIHLFGEEIEAAIFLIHVEFYGQHVIGCDRAHELCGTKSDGIGEKRTEHGLGEEHPRLAFRSA